MLNGNTIFTSDYLFPDLPELRYLTVCIGYALDENGDPYRYSNINVLDFSISKIQRTLADPLISCDGQTITLSCLTPGANIYYRLNQTGSYVQYSTPISIFADTVVQAYSTLYSQQSTTITQLCEYDDGLEEPVIDCDGESVSITCNTPSVDIYYRIGTSGSWILYDSPIEINATTVVQAYSDLNGHQSEIVQETCVYVPVVLATPVISCSDNEVTITCSTLRSTIYYRTDPSDPYIEYTVPITISQTTTFYAYSTYKSQTSTIVSQECVYVPAHDYSQDYLTFRVLTSGTILWKAIGTGYTRTIEYSINNGSWTSLTSTAAGAAIYVSENDVVRLRGSDTTYAKDKSNYSGFDGGTATYNVEGNMHSLLYGDNFASNSGNLSKNYKHIKNINIMKIQPLADRVLIKPAPAEEKTVGGIIIPDTAKEKPLKGEVVACGKGTKDEEMVVKVGDQVLYGKYAGQELEFEGVKYLIMRQSDIVAILA